MVNTGWQESFQNSEAVFDAPRISDHCPVLVTMLHDSNRRLFDSSISGCPMQHLILFCRGLGLEPSLDPLY